MPLERQRRAIRQLESLGVKVTFGDSPLDPFPAYVAGYDFEEPGWLTRFAHENLPVAYVRNVTAVNLDDSQHSNPAVMDLVSRVHNLRQLEITGTIDASSVRMVANAKNIKRLYFQSNSTVSKEALEQVGRMRQLKSLGFLGAEVDLDGLHHLRNLDSLETLFLKCVRCSDDSVEFLSGLRSLKWLEIETEGIEGHGLKHLAGLNFLERINFHGLQLADEDCKFLSTLPRIENLYLNRSNVTDRALRHLSGARQLRSLDLTSTQVRGTGLKYLAGCSSLRSLELANSRLETGLDELNRLGSLSYLGLSFNEITDDTISKLRLPNVKTIRISKTGISTNGLRIICRQNKSLKGVTTIKKLAVSDDERKQLEEEFPQVNFYF